VKEVKNGYEFGFTLENYEDLQEKDILECYEKIQERRN
jgi:translation initiation factor IF-2